MPCFVLFYNLDRTPFLTRPTQTNCVLNYCKLTLTHPTCGSTCRTPLAVMDQPMHHFPMSDVALTRREKYQDSEANRDNAARMVSQSTHQQRQIQHLFTRKINKIICTMHPLNNTMLKDLLTLLHSGQRICSPK